MDGNYIPDDDLDPQMEQDHLEQNTGDFGSDEIEIENSTSQLASTPGKNIILLVVLGIASVIFLYNIVFKEAPEVTEQKKIDKIIESQPVDNAEKPTQPEEDEIDIDITNVGTPDLPDFESIQPAPVPIEITEAPFFRAEEPEIEFKPEELPPTAEPISQPEIIEIEEIQPAVPLGPSPEQLAAMKAAKRRQGMIVTNGGGLPSQPVNSDGVTIGTSGISGINQTGASAVKATFIGNTDLLIAQGKMISAVLESAINTDLEGTLRAIVSRDVYAESGRNVLIPKGSRLIGAYGSSAEPGQTRVIITWNRVIRPDGIDIAISSPGTDQLGRAGMSGFVDNRYFDIISNAVLLSAITIGGAIFVDSIQESQTTSSSTTTGTDGSTTSTSSGTPSDAAVLSGVGELSDVTADIAEGLLNDDPTIIIQQGERIKVFVNHDLHFPESSVNTVKFLN